MLKSHFFLSLFLLASISIHSQQLTSKVNKVTLYPDGAQIYRQANTTLNRGHQTIQIIQLPSSINANKLKVTLPENVKLLSVEYDQNYLQEKETNPAIEELKGKIKTQEKELAEVTAREKATHLQLQYLKHQKSNATPSTANQYESLLDLVARKTYKLEVELHEIKVKKEPLQKRLQELKAQLRNEQQAYREKPGMVALEIYAPQNTTAEISLSYFTNRAYWRNAYRARVTDLSDSLQMEQRAVCVQRTGENWDEVSLTFASAKPSQNQQLPPLNPWQIGFINNQTYKINPMASRTVDDVSNAKRDEVYGMELETGKVPAQYGNASPVDRLTFQAISLPRKVNLPSSSEAKTFDLRAFNIPAHYVYLCRPHQDQAVYLTAMITDWEQYNLQSGNIALFNGNTYIGKYFFNHRSPADTLELNLGKDENFKVRVDSKTILETKLLSSKEELTHRYSIYIRNAKNTSAKIRVQDQYPLSQHEDLEVELLGSGRAEVDKRKGFLTWNKTITSGKQNLFQFAYKLTYPKDKKPAL